MAASRPSEATNSTDSMAGKRQAREAPYVDRALTRGWRIGDIQVRVDQGKAIMVATKIFQLYDRVLETSTRVDSDINLVARIYYGSSQELHAFMEVLKGTRYVKDVRFSEISAIIDRRAFAETESPEKPLLSSSKK